MGIELVDKLEFYMKENNGLIVASEVSCVHPAYFYNDGSIESAKSIFTPNPNSYEDDVKFNKLDTKSSYLYALSSALLRKSKDAMAEVFGGEKAKKEKDPVEAEREKKIKEVLDKWKEDNKGNQKYIGEQYVMQAATGYYAGKQGNEISDFAKLKKLKYEELFVICKLCEEVKNDASDSVKKDGDSNWLSKRVSFTPEGWRQREIIKNDAKFKFGYISKDEHDKKAEWCETFDFHPGWNFKEENENVITNLEAKLTDNGFAAVSEFNKAFCANAIGKLGIYRID